MLRTIWIVAVVLIELALVDKSLVLAGAVGTHWTRCAVTVIVAGRLTGAGRDQGASYEEK